jgi:uncharacterized membrane protein
MNLRRITKHMLTGDWQLKRAFPRASLHAIEQAIQASETAHAGEIRFVVEAALEGTPLLKGQTARERAVELFSQLRVWDTEHNNGLLIYLLLADHAVEILADRGIHGKVPAQAWSAICRQMEAQFKQAHFEQGVLDGVQSVTRHLAAHFPRSGHKPNELPDRPVVL